MKKISGDIGVVPYLKEEVDFLFVGAEEKLGELDTDGTSFHDSPHCIAGAELKADLIEGFVSMGNQVHAPPPSLDPTTSRTVT